MNTDPQEPSDAYHAEHPLIGLPSSLPGFPDIKPPADMFLSPETHTIFIDCRADTMLTGIPTRQIATTRVVSAP